MSVHKNLIRHARTVGVLATLVATVPAVDLPMGKGDGDKVWMFRWRGGTSLASI